MIFIISWNKHSRIVTYQKDIVGDVVELVWRLIDERLNGLKS